MPKGFSIFGASLPTWLTHILASLFLHQDLVFLHHQEKLLAQRSPNNYMSLFYTPNPQDKMVIAFRQWLLKRAGGKIPWFGYDKLPPAEADKNKLFDVWTTHTKDCQVCQRALNNIKRVTNFSYISAAICLFLGIMLDARLSAQSALNSDEIWLIAPHWSFWLLMGSGTLLGLGGYFLQKFSRLFYVYKFEHAHND